MDTTARFSLFSALPIELRLLIWEEALLVTNVLTMADTTRSSGDAPIQPSGRLLVGPTPGHIGMVCREARRQLIHSFVTISVPGLRGLFRHCGAQNWLDLDRTVFYFGSGREARTVISDLDDSQISRVRLAAFHYGDWETLARMCLSIAQRCPHVHTVIVVRYSATSTGTASGIKLSAGTVEQLVRLSRRIGPPHQDGELDSDYFRATLLQAFGGTPPVLHMIQADPGDLP
ncbi:hypothetical protein EJ03DRAFT_88087 [Teratosphaeria nubilosa]|uniref:2EXR domain-containing protein n=1 Tax=Teratosphaeria nubilosa TaxID=161662 RepID=A0A6G1LA93_9PEZI|nr:hypothetical protein EJ03DRAFT_88087 [Teratosphaeria nubilosa]